jgi:hypothetical protein
MSTRYENKIIMPNGPMGRTTLLGLSPEDLANEQRWHSKEWHAFVKEIQAYKLRILEAGRSNFLRWYDKAQHCPKCAARRRFILSMAANFKGPKAQRGSILLSAFKSAAAGGDCTYTASTIPNVTDFCVNPCAARTAARLHSDGDWYSNAGTGFGTSDGTWQGSCAVADYDTRHIKNSGDDSNYLTSGVNATWSAASTSKAVGYNQNGFGTLSGNFSLECRDGTSLNLLFSDSFSMTAEVDAKN